MIQFKPRTDKTPMSGWSYIGDPIDDLSKVQKDYGLEVCDASSIGLMIENWRLWRYPQAQPGENYWNEQLQRYTFATNGGDDYCELCGGPCPYPISFIRDGKMLEGTTSDSSTSDNPHVPTGI